MTYDPFAESTTVPLSFDLPLGEMTCPECQRGFVEGDDVTIEARRHTGPVDDGYPVMRLQTWHTECVPDPPHSHRFPCGCSRCTDGPA